MTNERKVELTNNMIEYLDNYGCDLESIGIKDDMDIDKMYNNATGYLVELVNENYKFWEDVIGFNREELIEEGMEWLYPDENEYKVERFDEWESFGSKKIKTKVDNLYILAKEILGISKHNREYMPIEEEKIFEKISHFVGAYEKEFIG